MTRALLTYFNSCPDNNNNNLTFCWEPSYLSGLEILLIKENRLTLIEVKARIDPDISFL
jgi:hypothetical protein